MARLRRTTGRSLSLTATLGIAALVLGPAFAPAAGAVAQQSAPTLDQVLSGRHVLRSSAEVDQLAARTADDDGDRLIVVTDDAAGAAVRTVTAPGDQLDALADRLEDVHGVVAVGPDVRVSSTATSDTYSSRQYSLPRIRSNRLPTTATGNGVIVAVIDSGVDADHPDLIPPLPGGRPRVLPGVSFLSGLGIHPSTRYEPGNRDLGQHGTHVAGIIAAARNNNLGIAGAAPDAQILPVRVLDQRGAGWMSDVLEGIYYAHDQGADIINLSLAGAIGDPRAVAVMSAVIRDVRTDASRGKPPTIVVAAAGNSGASSPTLYPAADAGVIAVASTDANDRVTASSSRGTWLNVAAPGNAIVSTCGSGAPDFVFGGYCTMSGTSMASPLVAAAAAVLLQQNPSRTDVQAVLERTAYDVDILGRDRSSGAGRIDLATAFDPVASPKVPRTLTTVTGRLGSVTASGRSIVVQGTVSDPEGNVGMSVEFSGPGGWGRRSSTSVDGRFWVNWAAPPGDHLVCTFALDNPTGRSVPLGCANVLVK